MISLGDMRPAWRRPAGAQQRRLPLWHKRLAEIIDLAKNLDDPIQHHRLRHSAMTAYLKKLFRHNPLVARKPLIRVIYIFSMQAKRRYELTDAQWARLEPLLPPEKPGRSNDDHRQILNGILWVLNSGAPWRDLPRRHRPVGTVSSRFYRWRRAGVWHRVLEALQALADAEGRVGWELHFLDSTVVRAHQHAAGARKTGREPGAEDEALGRSRGGFTTKIHLRCEGYGKPVIFTVTGGQVHDTRQVSALISRGAIRRIGRGRLRPTKLVGDKAYSSRSIRLALRRRGITPVIPTKSAASPTSTARHTASATSSSA